MILLSSSSHMLGNRLHAVRVLRGLCIHGMDGNRRLAWIGLSFLSGLHKMEAWTGELPAMPAAVGGWSR